MTSAGIDPDGGVEYKQYCYEDKHVEHIFAI